MMDESSIKALATLQLNLAVLDGERWAIQHILKGPQEILLGQQSDAGKWDIEIHHVGQEPEPVEA